MNEVLRRLFETPPVELWTPDVFVVSPVCPLKTLRFCWGDSWRFQEPLVAGSHPVPSTRQKA